MEPMSDDFEKGYDDGFADGYAKGRADGFAEAHNAIEVEYEERIQKLYVGMIELNARIGALEKDLGLK